MTMQDFNKLSKVDQDSLISQQGMIVINFTQGDAISDIYKVHNFLVKVIPDGEGKKKIFAYGEHDNFKLSNREI